MNAEALQHNTAYTLQEFKFNSVLLVAVANNLTRLGC